VSGTTWTKFFWSDWDTDPALRLCSFAAQGLWMRMLCIAAAHDPIGYVAVAGRGLDETSIARMTGGSESEVRDLLGELDLNGVFSRDRHGRIYSRRMVSDAKRAAIARKNGKNGGNPSLGKDRGNLAPDNPPVKGGLKPQEPTAMSLEREKGSDDPSLSPGKPARERRGKASPIGDGFPDEPAIVEGEALVAASGVEVDVPDQARRFRSHALMNARTLADWGEAWRAWIETEIVKAKKSAPLASAPEPEPDPWPGPRDVWEAVAGRMGDAWARGYLSQTTVEGRTLFTTSRTVETQLRREVGRELQEIGVSVVVGIAKGRAA
jgi:hypothetical protein